MGVMWELSGRSPTVEKSELAERKFLEFDMDNFENRRAAIEPGVAFKVANKLGDGEGERMSVDMHFKKMDDFTPAAVARQVPSLAKLLQARDQLANLLRYMDGKEAAEDQIKMLLKDPQLMAAVRDRAPALAEQAELQPGDKNSRNGAKSWRSEQAPHPHAEQPSER